MRIRNRLLRWTTLAILLSGCADDAPSSTPMLPAPVTHADGALPNWMRSTEWAQRPWTKTPVGAVWRVRHAGQDAWLIDAPSRMARDTLVRSDGAVICNPPGFGAPGDGRCPTVVDAGTMPHLAWSHPGNPSPTFGPPLPMPESEATVALREPRASRPPLPAWLETRVATWERQDQSDADGISVSRLQHKGAATYLSTPAAATDTTRSTTRPGASCAARPGGSTARAMACAGACGSGYQGGHCLGASRRVAALRVRWPLLAFMAPTHGASSVPTSPGPARGGSAPRIAMRTAWSGPARSSSRPGVRGREWFSSASGCGR